MRSPGILLGLLLIFGSSTGIFGDDDYYDEYYYDDDEPREISKEQIKAIQSIMDAVLNQNIERADNRTSKELQTLSSRCVKYVDSFSKSCEAIKCETGHLFDKLKGGITKLTKKVIGKAKDFLKKGLKAIFRFRVRRVFKGIRKGIRKITRKIRRIVRLPRVRVRVRRALRRIGRSVRKISGKVRRLVRRVRLRVRVRRIVRLPRIRRIVRVRVRLGRWRRT
ncbi:uncharacterized protein LOC134253642 [Saccostrea cucullata]|uniref:uncharacterized protein LOC134253642 n=1 Tax=Saccostrea cuccullata TaxID=36930 RepID=UPI002ED3EFBF